MYVYDIPAKKWRVGKTEWLAEEESYRLLCL